MRRLSDRIKRLEKHTASASRDLLIVVTYVTHRDEGGVLWGYDAREIGLGWSRELAGPLRSLED